QLGELDAAEPHLLKALRLRTEAGDTIDSLMATSNFNVARLHTARGQHADALPFQEKSLEFFRAEHGPDHPDVAASLNNLAVIYRVVGRLEEAEQTMRQALEIRRNAIPDSVGTAHAMGVLGNILEARGRIEEAIELKVEALEMTRRHLPANHPRVANALYGLGFQMVKVDRPAEGEPLLREAVSIYRAAGANVSAWILSANLVALARGTIALGRPAEAERLAREGREVLIGTDDSTPRYRAWPAWMLGRALAAQGQVDEARVELELAISLFDEAEEPDRVGEVREELAALDAGTPDVDS
ncbi:MAG: tetratricopeptide repeat protein, partial [Acidobacteriota bacterium]